MYSSENDSSEFSSSHTSSGHTVQFVLPDYRPPKIPLRTNVNFMRPPPLPERSRFGLPTCLSSDEYAYKNRYQSHPQFYGQPSHASTLIRDISVHPEMNYRTKLPLPRTSLNNGVIYHENYDQLTFHSSQKCCKQIETRNILADLLKNEHMPSSIIDERQTTVQHIIPHLPLQTRHLSFGSISSQLPQTQTSTPQSQSQQLQYRAHERDIYEQQFYEHQLHKKVELANMKLRSLHLFNDQDVLRRRSLCCQPSFEICPQSKVTEKRQVRALTFPEVSAHTTQHKEPNSNENHCDNFEKATSNGQVSPKRIQIKLEEGTTRPFKTLEELAAQIHPSNLHKIQSKVTSESKQISHRKHADKRMGIYSNHNDTEISSFFKYYSATDVEDTGRREGRSTKSQVPNPAESEEDHEETLGEDAKIDSTCREDKSQSSGFDAVDYDSLTRDVTDENVNSDSSTRDIADENMGSDSSTGDIADENAHSDSSFGDITDENVNYEFSTGDITDKNVNPDEQKSVEQTDSQTATPIANQPCNETQENIKNSTSAEISLLIEQNSGGPVEVSVPHDSNFSSDSFSPNSSPSYTNKSMETPLLLHQKGSKKKSNNRSAKVPMITAAGTSKDFLRDNRIFELIGNNQLRTSSLTKSFSTPASLQAVARLRQASNMSLHHRIIRDIRRPSTHYPPRKRLMFRFGQVFTNAIALLAIAGCLAAYFKAYPTPVHYINKTVVPPPTAVAIPPISEAMNPAPGVCLPVIVTFCHYNRVSYNFTMFPNYIGHFTQRDAQQEFELFNAIVEVKCYDLAALFLCSVFVPKCGPTGKSVRPCRQLCHETKRRCGFFLELFGLVLPEYLDCDIFPESPDPNVCVGYHEVFDEQVRSLKPACRSGFQCDKKRCIPRDWRCDGHVDCEDQTDELNCDTCPKGMVHCGGRRCISQVHMCDGVLDCPWGQDERNCLRLSERMGDKGYGQLQVYHADSHKWQPACFKTWDNGTSARILCSILGYSKVNAIRLIGKGGNLNLITTTAIRSEWKGYRHKPRSILRDVKSCHGSHLTVDLSCANHVCGKQRRVTTPRPSYRIVGGMESSPGDWPFLVAILGGPEEIFYCAGVLIADQWVLTASHCVGNLSDPSGWTIQLGITRRHSHSYYGQKMKVRRVVPHPKYNQGVLHDNDVALFQLKSRVTFHDHLLPVCLPPPDHELVPGTLCTVIGWGKKEDSETTEYEPAVNEVEVPILRRELCNIWLENRELNVTEGMICAGYPEGGKDACQGDSGGPLLCRNESNDRWFVGGIVSWGIKCAHPHLPGVYTYIPRYIPWIIQKMSYLSF